MGDLKSLSYVRNYRCEDVKLRQKSYLRTPSDSVLTLRSSSSAFSGNHTHLSYQQPQQQHHHHLSYIAMVGLRVGGFRATSHVDISSSVSLLPHHSGGRGGLSLARYYPSSSKATARCNSADPDLTRGRCSSYAYRALTSSYSQPRQSPIHSQTPSLSNSRSASADRQFNSGTAAAGGWGKLGGGDNKITTLLPPSYNGTGCFSVTELAKNVSSYNWEREDDSGLQRDYNSSSSRPSSCATDTDSTLLGETGNILPTTTIATSNNNVAVASDLENFVSFSQQHNSHKELLMECKRKRARRSIYDRTCQNFGFTSTLTSEEEGTLARVRTTYTRKMHVDQVNANNSKWSYIQCNVILLILHSTLIVDIMVLDYGILITEWNETKIECNRNLHTPTPTRSSDFSLTPKREEIKSAHPLHAYVHNMQIYALSSRLSWYK